MINKFNQAILSDDIVEIDEIIESIETDSQLKEYESKEIQEQIQTLLSLMSTTDMIIKQNRYLVGCLLEHKNKLCQQ